MRVILKSLILLAAFYSTSSPQILDLFDSPEEGLRQANEDYEAGNYKQAYLKFSILADSFASDNHNSIFRFMAAKSLFRMGDYRKAIISWGEFIEMFPASRMVGEARLFKGHSLYFQGNLPAAATQYILAIENDPGSDVAEIAMGNLTPLIKRGLTISQLSDLAAAHPASPVSDMMEFALGKREIDGGHFRKGVAILKSFMAHYPGSRDFKQARLLLQDAHEKSQNEVVIGLMAPVSGSFQEYGHSMVEGATLAMKNIPDKSTKIKLVIKDTQGDPINAARAAAAIAEEEPLAVVGPLRSESSLASAIVLNERGIPMITPTASETGLTDIGPNIFQVSPSTEQMGRSLARYAVKNLKINEFAIIAPDDAGGIKIANAFAEAVYEFGGEVALTSYYTPGATDFRQQIMPLRDILLARTEEQLSDGRLDSADFIDPKTSEIRVREEWPVNLGGLFLPGYAEDLKMLIPQVRYHVIRSRFLGSDSWDSKELMREVRQYVDSAVFATDYHVDLDNSGWAAFAKLFAGTYNHQPDKVAALTYDAINLVIRGIQNGYNDPDRMREYLSGINNYEGVSTMINFKDTGRANDEVGIYSIDGKKLITSR